MLANAMRPTLSIAYTDPVEGTRGYLVIDRLVHGLAAGGLRVHPQVTLEEVTELARNMTVKQAVVGIEVGGAKAGLAMDPGAPERAQVLTRFMEHLRPYIVDCWCS
jgi:glutamate dehydrogenase (NAD(P)+)